ncbi:MAG: ABC1 kinase family protein, partial [Gaiellaceae bacterium]
MPKRDEKPIPTGRVRRTAKVGRLAGEQIARSAATKAANVTRTPEGRRLAVERRQIQAAEQIVNVLGTMKGAAMKVGQVASFIDVAGMPPEAQDLFQAKLAELRDAAPQVSFKDMRKVIERDLEQPLGEAFAEFEEDAVAAASIGQVYRARLHDGRRVAVKVQYPGVAQAVRADLQNLGLLLRAARTMAPGLDAKALGTEIRDRVTEELDYEHEAQSQRAMARAWRGHPFVVVPDVVTSLSREHVLVTEWVDGTGFEDVKRLPREEQDRFGEIVFRFFIGSLWRTGFFSGDPHPGNYLLLEYGRVAFLDFGMTKKLSFEHLSVEREFVRAALEGDADEFYERVLEAGYYKPGDEAISPERVIAHAAALTAWEREDREFTISRDYIA